jgi:hypothetical protein
MTSPAMAIASNSQHSVSAQQDFFAETTTAALHAVVEGSSKQQAVGASQLGCEVAQQDLRLGAAMSRPKSAGLPTDAE